jgi:hypothetical protein
MVPEVRLRLPRPKWSVRRLLHGYPGRTQHFIEVRIAGVNEA